MKHELVEPTTLIQDLLREIGTDSAEEKSPAVLAAKEYMARYYSESKVDGVAALLEEYPTYLDDAIDTAKLMVYQMQKDGLTDQIVLLEVLENLCCQIMTHVPKEAFDIEQEVLTTSRA